MLRLRSRNALAALLLLALAPACPDAEPEGPPDVYLIVIDTLRADRLSCYGYPRTTSPFLDELAAEGALFLENTSQSSWTKPSMVSLMSGAYVTAYRDVMPDGVPSLAQSFQDAGYHTIGVVGNVLLSSKLGFDRGFDHYDAREITDEEREEMRARGLREPVCRPVALMLEELAPHLDAEFDRISPYLESIPLRLGDVLCESDGTLDYVVFPTTAIISLHYLLENGSSSEIAGVGNEGMLGVALFMGGGSTPSTSPARASRRCWPSRA